MFVTFSEHQRSETVQSDKMCKEYQFDLPLKFHSFFAVAKIYATLNAAFYTQFTTIRDGPS